MSNPDDAAPPIATVLVVDDTPESLRFLTKTLEREQVRVLIAIDGLAALDVLRHVAPDLILMDAVMPNLDGFETAERIKADPAFAHIPIIFMTGLTETEHVVRGFGVGGVDYVHKPIVIDELLARIRVHLATARVTRGSQLALDTSGRPAFAVNNDGTPRWFTPAAAEILERHFGGWSPNAGALPAGLSAPLRHLQTNNPNPGARMSVDIEDCTLDVEFLRRGGGEEWLFRLAERRSGDEERLLASAHNLTSREAEVLLWVSRGKQNREVSEILQISPRTVSKHLEQIFEKMGVENRASAAAIAVATLAR